MSTVLLLVELFVTLALIGIVLIQRSEGGGLGIGGSQGMGSFMSGRGTANLLTRATAILATIFMVLAIAIGLLHRSSTGNSILNVPPPPAHTTSESTHAPVPKAGSPTPAPGPKASSPAAASLAPAPTLAPAPSGPQVPTQPAAPTVPTP